MITFFHKTPKFIEWLYPGLRWHYRKTVKDEVYLTFDDGPIPDLTPKILKILGDYDAKATFFCVGDNIRKHPDIFKMLLEGGHKPANHTYHHLKGWKTPARTYIEDVAKCREEMKAHNRDSCLLRPPYGMISRAQIRRLPDEYTIVMWDVLTGDFDENLRPEDCWERTRRAIRPGSIIVMHDNLKAAPRVLYVLPRLLEFIKSKGWSCPVLPS